jgi:hypothetical protein
MARRSVQARALAQHLTDQAHTPVTICWDNPSGRPGHGAWRVHWTDGPTTNRLRALAAAHARWVRPLPVDELLFSRQHSPQAWAAALLTRAHHATLPDTASAAVGLVEHDLHDTDAATRTDDTLRAAADLASHGHANPMRMAEALLTGHVTPRRNQPPQPRRGHQDRRTATTTTGQRPLPTQHNTDRTSSQELHPINGPQPSAVTTPRCGHCAAALPSPASTGRPPRWCSPACRTRAWRERRNITSHDDPSGHRTAAPKPSDDEYRYVTPAGRTCPTHPECHTVRCARFLCGNPVHRRHNQRGQPRQFCSTACRVANHRLLH